MCHRMLLVIGNVGERVADERGEEQWDFSDEVSAATDSPILTYRRLRLSGRGSLSRKRR